MKALMDMITDAKLADDILVAAGLVIKTHEGSLLKYMGNGMAKNSKDGLEDVEVDSIESMSVGAPPAIPTPVLSTEDRPNGIPKGIDADVASPPDSGDNGENKKPDPGIDRPVDVPNPKTPGEGEKAQGKPLFKV